MTWISDAKGNRCSVERWGSEAEARKALESLKDCSDCSECSDCSDCSDCSRCSECSGCSGCSGCSRCSDLKRAAPGAGGRGEKVSLELSLYELDAQQNLREIAQGISVQGSGWLRDLRAEMERAPHGWCSFQFEPHCEHCKKPRDEHYWDSEWAKDGTCKDERGRPKPTHWSPLNPLPCNCYRSTLLPMIEGLIQRLGRLAHEPH
jgi:hypothetical protein